MISVEECVGLSDLQEDEVAAIAEHEHVPTIVAAGMGNELLKTPRGVYQLHVMFRENLEQACGRRQLDRAKSIERTYRRFMAAHPLPRVL